MSDSWEYKTVVQALGAKDLLKGSGAAALGAVLELHGADGWELASGLPIALGSAMNMNSQTGGVLLIFKRPAPGS